MLLTYLGHIIAVARSIGTATLLFRNDARILTTGGLAEVELYECFFLVIINTTTIILLRATAATAYAIARICHANSVCLSVCPSVTRMLRVKTAERIIEILSLSDRPIILVFSTPKVVAQI